MGTGDRAGVVFNGYLGPCWCSLKWVLGTTLVSSLMGTGDCTVVV